MEIPIYLFTGFLEAGKTKLIQETLSDPGFNNGKENILVVLCEEGEEEFNPFECPGDGKNLSVEVIERIEQINSDKLSALQRKNKATRIIIEYNGMWNCKDLVLPDDWGVEQQITTIDATTFPMYYANMKSMVAEMVRKNTFSLPLKKSLSLRVAASISAMGQPFIPALIISRYISETNGSEETIRSGI